MNLKQGLKNIWIELDITAKKIQILYIFVTGLLVLTAFSTYAGFLSKYAVPRAIIQAFDDDASYGIETAVKANWINHNGSTLYGPLYYYFATPAKYVLQNSYDTEGYSDLEKTERNVFFTLMIVNLAAIFAASYLFLSFITPSLWWSLGGSILLSGLFLQNQYRAFLLFLPKPDSLLAFMMAFATATTWYWLERRDEKRLRMMALGWSLASMTKLITIFFGPSLIFILWAGSRLEFKKNFKYFAKWFLVFYLGIGFPQTWDLGGYLKYLLQQNSHTSLVSWQFLTEEWLPLYWNDLWMPAAFMAVFSLLVPLRQYTFENKNLAKLGIFTFMGLCMLFAKQTPDPHNWYTFSFVSVTLGFWAYFLVWIHQSNNLRFEKFLSPLRKSLWTSAVVFALMPLGPEVFPKQVEEQYLKVMNCRPEALEVKKFIDEKTHAQKLVFADPYVPFDLAMQDKYVFTNWVKTFEALKARDYEYMALNNHFYAVHLIDNNPAITYLDNKAPVTAFYRTFAGKTEATDPTGTKWSKVYQDSCHFEIWERAPKAP